MAETASRSERTLSDAMHEVITEWINHGQEIVDKTVKAVDEINGAFERAYSTATKGTLDCGAKVIQATRSNTLSVRCCG
jgi:hypothetical protein